MARLKVNGYKETFPYPETKDRFFDVNISILSADSRSPDMRVCSDRPFEERADVRVFRNASNFFWSWSVPSVEELDLCWNYALGEAVINWCRENVK